MNRAYWIPNTLAVGAVFVLYTVATWTARSIEHEIQGDHVSGTFAVFVVPLIVDTTLALLAGIALAKLLRTASSVPWSLMFGVLVVVSQWLTTTIYTLSWTNVVWLGLQVTVPICTVAAVLAGVAARSQHPGRHAA